MKKKLFFFSVLAIAFFLTLSGQEAQAGCKTDYRNTSASGVVAQLKSSVYNPWASGDWSTASSSAVSSLKDAFNSDTLYKFTTSAGDAKIVNDSVKYLRGKMAEMEKTFYNQVVAYTASKKYDRCQASCLEVYAPKLKVASVYLATTTKQLSNKFTDNNNWLNSANNEVNKTFSFSTSTSALKQKCLVLAGSAKYSAVPNISSVCDSTAGSVSGLQADLKNGFYSKFLSYKVDTLKDDCNTIQTSLNTLMSSSVSVADASGSNLSQVKNSCTLKLKAIYEAFKKGLDQTKASCQS